MTLLTQIAAERREAREALRLRTRERLREALGELLPGRACWVYGSLTQAGRFAEWSDVDLALEEEPEGRSIYLLMSLLSERVGREVDVALLGETRLREKIVKEGERWIA
jgi:predicted nucleotidyltransferase